MSATFIAVVIIMALLIGLVLVILQSLAGAAGVRIRADMVKLLEAYDQVIETKSREVGRLQDRAERLRATAEADWTEVRSPEAAQPVRAPIPKSAGYRSGALGDSYCAIRSSFHLSGEECELLAAQVAEDAAREGELRGEAAARLRGALSFDTVFRLVQLPGDEQLEVLDATLDDEGWTLLRDYCALRDADVFDAGRFCHWLEELAELEGGTMQIRRGGTEAGERGICEGVQIVAGGKLYDFSIQEREIG